MQINTKECGAKQIILDSTDNYELLFLDECGTEVLYAFSEHESHSFMVLKYPKGMREDQYRFSVKTKV
jgi:DNA replication protein DnaC